MMPREGKYPHAFCIGIDNPGDVRVLCNLDATARWMGTTLHEFGHALYNTKIDPGLPYVLRDSAHTFVTEAVAMLFGRLPKDPTWLMEVAGVPEDRAIEAGRRLRIDQLTFARWGLVVTLFERALYADPNADLNTVWWELVTELQGLSRPEGWDAPDWASKLHIACYPAYYQYYLLGELFASQLSVSMADADDPGSFLVDLFKAGSSIRWDELVRRCCGADLHSGAWLAEFAS
jgi:peptidyl-dipeptidase A